MAIHPIDYRYNTPEMRALFEEDNILQRKLDVEAALARVHAKLGNIPKNSAVEISKKSSIRHVTMERVREIDEQIHHDLMAIVKALSEQCKGDAGKYVHLGATSYDVVDSAYGTLLRDAVILIRKNVEKLKHILLEKAQKYKGVVMIGRTHGQHAVPITLGLKFAVWAAEVQRHLDRIGEVLPIVGVGKMSGAVGTGAALGKKAIKVQEMVMKELNLGVPLATTQTLQRDRHAHAIFVLVLITQTLYKIALEIRNLQRTEIGEIEEPFSEKQVGSSTMPHKRNPHRSERICGLARNVKANLIVALDNIPLEHERDLTNSSSDRLVFSEAFILTDYLLSEANDILSRLRVDEKRIRKNLGLTRGRIMAEAVMVRLVERGMGRQEAHELIRVCAMESFEKDIEISTLLINNKEVRKYLSIKDIQDSLNPENHIGAAIEIVDSVVKKLGKK